MIGLAQIGMLYQIKYSSQYLQVEVDYTINQGENILKIRIHHSYHINGTKELNDLTKIHHIQPKKRYGLVIWYHQVIQVPKYQKK